MTEKEKMLAGLLYRPSDVTLSEERETARNLFQAFNKTKESEKEKRREILSDLLGEIASNTFIEPPFFCDYGYNISLGKNVFINYNCIFLDVNKISIGDNVMIAPMVQVYTATHPVEFEARNSGAELGFPIDIESGVWIGGGAVILPGIRIGKQSVIAAGSVVTKDVPSNVLVAGNPARIIRKINNEI